MIYERKEQFGMEYEKKTRRAWQDLNPQQPDPKSGTLSIELQAHQGNIIMFVNYWKSGIL